MKVLKFIVVYAACLFLLSAFIGTGHPEWSYVFVGVISLVIAIKLAGSELFGKLPSVITHEQVEAAVEQHLVKISACNTWPEKMLNCAKSLGYLDALVDSKTIDKALWNKLTEKILILAANESKDKPTGDA